MVDIVNLGEKKSSSSGIIGELAPLVLLAGLGYLAYKMLFSGDAANSGQATNNQVSQGNTVTQPSQNNNSAGSPSNMQVNQSAVKATLQSILNTPGTYVDTRNGQVYQGSGLGGLFVTAGPTTPTNFFPLGNVITTDRDLSAAEQARVIANLANSQASAGIRNAWWQPQTLTQTTQPGGVNSGGSFQSNVPLGRNHCKCPYPGCGPNDDWTYC